MWEIRNQKNNKTNNLNTADTDSVIVSLNQINMSPKQSAQTAKTNTATVETKDRAGSVCSTGSDVSKLPDDHPVHRIPLKKQEKMRKKGVNPVLRAEMDAATDNGFFSKWAKTSTGPWFV